MRARRLRTRLLVLGAAALGVAALLELGTRGWIEWRGLRPLATAWREYATGRQTPALVPHAQLGFVRNPDWSRDVNASGFFGPEWSLEPAAGTLRIACLGASTTEPDPNDGIAASYPWQLRDELAARSVRAVEVLNFGISGWSSLEIRACWEHVARHYRPDLVVLHEAINDAVARSLPGFREDYAHFRKPLELPRPGALERVALDWSDAWLFFELESGLRSLGEATIRRPSGPTTFRDGRFPPGTESAYRRNFAAIVADARGVGVDVVLATLPWDPALDAAADATTAMHRAAMREHNAIARELAANGGAMLCDLERLAAAEPAALDGCFKDVVHLTPTGNARKARWIAELLEREWGRLREPAPR